VQTSWLLWQNWEGESADPVVMVCGSISGNQFYLFRALFKLKTTGSQTPKTLGQKDS